MATAYQWVSEEGEPQGLKPPVGKTNLLRLKPRPTTLEESAQVQKAHILGSDNGTARVVPSRLQVVSPRASRDHRKTSLVELYTVKKIDNSRLVRNVEPVRLKNFYKTAALGAVIAFFCMFYVYQHFRCIDLSFQLEDLKAKQAQAQALNSGLRLEIATLRDPRRIDVIARRQLGLTQPTAMQVREYANLDGAEVAAVMQRSKEVRK